MQPCKVLHFNTNKDGYAYMTMGSQHVLMHRFVWECFNRNLEEGEVVRHTCDNPPCLEPTHLLVGTQQDNIRDMVERGRNHTKLTAESVRQIRKLFKADIYPSVLAELFDVSETTIFNIIDRRSWKHVD